jgi:hypothetical protein
MIMWLDHLIFGNGYGLGSPYFDQRFYWLSGQLYTWIGGFGAQLQSFQWVHPKPGERRMLAAREFVAFNSSRRWLRVSVSWSMVGLPHGIDEANAAIRGLKRDLER